MATVWTHRLLILARETQNTPAIRQAYGDIYANNGSGESSADEGNALQNAVKLQRVTNPGVIFARALYTPMNASIRPLIKDFCLNTLTANRMFLEVDANDDNILRLYQVLGVVTTDETDSGTIASIFGTSVFSAGAIMAYLLITFGVEPYVAP